MSTLAQCVEAAANHAYYYVIRVYAPHSLATKTNLLMNMQGKQTGRSVIGNIIMLAVFGFGLYLAFQYIPLHIESGTVDSILNNIKAKHKASPVRSVDEILDLIERQLDVNQMTDLKDDFYVRQIRGTYVIKVSYQRELNLIYEKKPMHYEKTLALR